MCCVWKLQGTTPLTSVSFIYIHPLCACWCCRVPVSSCPSSRVWPVSRCCKQAACRSARLAPQGTVALLHSRCVYIRACVFVCVSRRDTHHVSLTSGSLCKPCVCLCVSPRSPVRIPSTCHRGVGCKGRMTGPRTDAVYKASRTGSIQCRVCVCFISAPCMTFCVCVCVCTFRSQLSSHSYFDAAAPCFLQCRTKA